MWWSFPASGYAGFPALGLRFESLIRLPLPSFSCAVAWLALSDGEVWKPALTCAFAVLGQKLAAWASKAAWTPVALFTAFCWTLGFLLPKLKLLLSQVVGMLPVGGVAGGGAGFLPRGYKPESRSASPPTDFSTKVLSAGSMVSRVPIGKAADSEAAERAKAMAIDNFMMCVV